MASTLFYARSVFSQAVCDRLNLPSLAEGQKLSVRIGDTSIVRADIGTCGRPSRPNRHGEQVFLA